MLGVGSYPYYNTASTPHLWRAAVVKSVYESSAELQKKKLRPSRISSSSLRWNCPDTISTVRKSSIEISPLPAMSTFRCAGKAR